MPLQTIVKTGRTLSETPNLDNYKKVCADFSWTKARNELNGLPDGKGLNIAFEAVDRHASGPLSKHVAIRWLGKSGETRDLYAMGTALERHQAQTDIALKAAGYGVPAAAVDGMDVNAVETATRAAIERLRAGDGPYLLECRTYRFRALSMYDPELYRSKEEVEQWKTQCPITALEARLGSEDQFLDKTRAEMETAIAAEIERAVAFAEAGPWEPVEDLLKDVLTLEQGKD